MALRPETKRLTLEEMDILFGSGGTVQADFERMRRIRGEIGMDELVHGYDNLDEKQPRTVEFEGV